jgi:hypothetical protein
MIEYQSHQTQVQSNQAISSSMLVVKTKANPTSGAEAHITNQYHLRIDPKNAASFLTKINH